RAVLPRIDGRGTRIMCPDERVLRGRGADEDGLLARPERPRRWTLPMTALRVIPPSSAAIWLADRPSAHSFFRSSTLSSVQPIDFLLKLQGLGWNPPPSSDALSGAKRIRVRNGPEIARQHDMSYYLTARLQ